MAVPKPDIDNWDKITHLAAFAALTYYALRGFAPVRDMRIIFIALMTYGFLIECIQYFIPNRTFSMIDLAADGIGILFVLVIKRRISMALGR